MIRRYAIAAVAGIVIIILFFVFVLSPKLSQINEVREEISTAEDQAQSLRNQLRALQTAQRDEPTIRARLATFDRLLPPTPDLPAAIRQLQTAATRAGIDLRSIAPSPPNDLTGATGVQVITVNLQIVGGFFRLQSFLTRLEDLQRVVEVTSLAVAPQTEEATGLFTLSSTITFRMYVVSATARLGGAAPTPAPGATN